MEKAKSTSSASQRTATYAVPTGDPEKPVRRPQMRDQDSVINEPSDSFQKSDVKKPGSPSKADLKRQLTDPLCPKAQRFKKSDSHDASSVLFSPPADARNEPTAVHTQSQTIARSIPTQDRSRAEELAELKRDIMNPKIQSEEDFMKNVEASIRAVANSPEAIERVRDLAKVVEHRSRFGFMPELKKR